MDPINIIAAVNVIVLFGASVSSAKKGLKTSVSAIKEKPVTFLQKVPHIAAIILLLQILGLFGIGTLNFDKYQSVRIIALGVYVVFSWLQIWASKSLGNMYAQEIVILKNHILIKKGLYRIIRHPQYVTQIITDISLSVVTFSFLAGPLAIINVPLIVMRALAEDKLLEKHFKSEFAEYKKHSGLLLPFIG